MENRITESLREQPVSKKKSGLSKPPITKNSFYLCKPDMTNQTGFFKYSFFVLIVIFLVMIAGSVVRCTQSGMGCPDWPKCFGQYIPPTKMEQVVFNANRQYAKGQFILYNDSLKYAKQRFISAAVFNQADWLSYTKHDYASFEVYKTWIEYINRLLGALLGLFILVQCIWSYRLKKTNKKYFFLSLLLLVLTGFQAWLGKTVVDSNLEVLKISAHLAGAFAMLLTELLILQKPEVQKIYLPNNAVRLLYLLFALLVVQLFLGVGVRQMVDLVSKKYLFVNRGLWLKDAGWIFYLHRSFSLVLFTGTVYIFYRYKKYINIPLFRLFFISLCLQLLVGIVFNYFQFPAIAQPLHLILSGVLLSAIFLLLMRKKLTN
jgi:cytochrome c oxidase assembly protein subunit 15